jgi:hypothetical protein
MIALLNTIKVLFLSITTHSPPLRRQSAETSVPQFGPNPSIQLVSLARGNTISAGSGYPALARIPQAQPSHSQSPSAQPAPAQSAQDHSPPTSRFKKSTFWTLLLGGLTIVTGLLFFLLQWLYMNWTAQKDFIEYCEGLQVSPSLHESKGHPGSLLMVNLGRITETLSQHHAKKH